MHLAILAKGRKWTVLAVCEEDWSCPIMEFATSIPVKHRRKVLSDLREYVPDSTPQKWVGQRFSWMLRGSNAILEFRWSAGKGGVPRALWFYAPDLRATLVLTHGVWKDDDELDETEIRRAEAIKARFILDQAKNRLELRNIDDI